MHLSYATARTICQDSGQLYAAATEYTIQMGYFAKINLVQFSFCLLRKIWVCGMMRLSGKSVFTEINCSMHFATNFFLTEYYKTEKQITKSCLGFF